MLIAIGLMQHPHISDRREQVYVAPEPDDPFAQHKAMLLQHGLVRLHDLNSTPLSRALGEADLRSK